MNQNTLNEFVEKYASKLENIYRQFIDYGIINDDELELDFNIMLRDLYDLNKFLNITYLIFSDESINEETKAIKLSTLRDSYGNLLLTLPQARKVVKIYSKPLTNFFKKIYNRKFEIVSNSDNPQNDNTYNSKDIIDDEIRSSIERVISGQSGGAISMKIPDTPKIPIDINKLKDSIKVQENNINEEDAISIYSDIYDWIFHPLWKLENNNLMGFMFPIPLDIIGGIIDTINLINPFVMIIMHKVVAAVGTGVAAGLGGAIGTAIGALFVGVGAVVGGPIGPAITAGFWPAIGQPIVVWILDHYIDVISMFYNISRKKMGLAYLSALDAIPYFEVILDFFVKKLLKINSKLEKIYPITNTIRAGVQVTDSIITGILEDPNSLLQADKFYKKIVKKNLKKLPQFKNMSDEELEVYEQHMETIYRTGKKSVDCILSKKEDLIKNSAAGVSNLEAINGCFSNFNIKELVMSKIPGLDKIPELDKISL